jgi:hypothetical protein
VNVAHDTSVSPQTIILHEVANESTEANLAVEEKEHEKVCIYKRRRRRRRDRIEI